MSIAKNSPIKIYIAGPFFNQLQLDLIKQIEYVLINNEIDFYSPRLHPGNEGGPINNETAKKIFQSNVEAINHCSHLLAVLDWLLPFSHELRVTREAEGSEFKGESHLTFTQTLSPPLSLPDTGTVFEMGVASGIRPIIGYTEKKEGEGKLNIMLTQACHGMIYGREHLRTCFQSGQISWDNLKGWTGKNL